MVAMAGFLAPLLLGAARAAPGISAHGSVGWVVRAEAQRIEASLSVGHRL